MDKREKVINELETARQLAWNGEHCNIMDADDALTVSYAITDALALLRAQEPRVIKNSAGNGICPGCGHIIPAWSSPNYCGYCGQAVKWE